MKKPKTPLAKGNKFHGICTITSGFQISFLSRINYNTNNNNNNNNNNSNNNNNDNNDDDNNI